MVAQIALSVALLVAAGLFGRSLFEAERADLGFRPDGVLNVYMDVGQLGYAEPQGRAFFDEIERSVRAIPGIRTASFAFTIPMGYIRSSEAVEAEGGPSASAERMTAGKNLVSREYFEMMGIELVQGRSFSDEDDERSRPVAIVNRRLAAGLWPGQDAIGRRFRPVARRGPWIEVIGVVGTGKYHFLFEDPQPYFYLPIAQEYTGLRVLQVRTSVAPESVRSAIERTIGAHEPNLPLYDVQSMAQALGSGPGLFPARVGAVAITTFGLLAFALAIVGLYGLVSYLASQRGHEIGVRVAVGATRRDVVRLVLRDGLALVGVEAAAADRACLAAGDLLVLEAFAGKRFRVWTWTRCQSAGITQRSFFARLGHALGARLGAIEASGGCQEISSARATDGQFRMFRRLHIARISFLLFHGRVARPLPFVGHCVAPLGRKTGNSKAGLPNAEWLRRGQNFCRAGSDFWQYRAGIGGLSFTQEGELWA